MGAFNYIWSWLCKRVYNRVDHNKDGLIDALEIEVAVLHLYNLVNKRLPGWQDPPTRDAIQAALREYDADGNGKLSEPEFEKFAASLLHAGPDMFFARVGKNAVLKTALLPAVTLGVKNSAGAMGLDGLKDVPTAVLAPALGCVAGAIRALVPV